MIQLGLSLRRFWNLPNPKAIVTLNGTVIPLMFPDGSGLRPMKKWELCYSLAKAILSSTTGLGRHRILRGGFVDFQKSFYGFIGHASEFHFSQTEIRCIYDAIEDWILTCEADLQPTFARQYENRFSLERQAEREDGRQQNATLEEDDAPIVERVEDGALKRVDPYDVRSRSSRRHQVH